MADTPRTQAELLVIFADNVTQDISAQDMRDYVLSVTPGGAVSQIQFNNTDSFVVIAGLPQMGVVALILLEI